MSLIRKRILFLNLAICLILLSITSYSSNLFAIAYGNNSNNQPLIITNEGMYYGQSLTQGNITTIDNNSTKSTYNNDYSAVYSSIKRPEWYEFCPLEFENPKHYGIPITNPQFDSNYWYKRKNEFESLLSDCDKRVGQYKDICYEKLRSRENSLSASWIPMRDKCQNMVNARQEAQMQYALIDAIKNKNINVNHSGTVNVNGNYRFNGNVHYY